MPYPAEKRVMWLANVRGLPYRERIATAARAGFGWISTSPIDYDQIGRAASLITTSARSRPITTSV